MRHVISIVVEDRFGALARIVELFTSRGYNLDSICSGEAETEGVHRITIVTQGDDRKIRHIVKLLKNIVYVFEVTHLDPSEHLSRELMVARLKINSEVRGQVLQLINAYNGTIIEMNGDTLVFQVVGGAAQLDGVAQVFREYEIIEMARTGEAAIRKTLSS